jgi:hypothetical protein
VYSNFLHSTVGVLALAAPAAFPADISSPISLIALFYLCFYRLEDSFQRGINIQQTDRDRSFFSSVHRATFLTFFRVSSTAGNLETTASFSSLEEGSSRGSHERRYSYHLVRQGYTSSILYWNFLNATLTTSCPFPSIPKYQPPQP